MNVSRRWVSEIAVAAIFYVIAAILVSLIVIAVAFLCIEISTITPADDSPPDLAVKIADFVLGQFSQDLGSLGNNTRAAIAASILSLLYAIAAVLAAVGSVVAYYRHRIALHRAQIVETYPVRKVGVHDLKTMYRYFKKATEIIVFSGSFKWVLKQESLRSLIVDLANDKKILLVTYRSEQDIKAAWKAEARKLGLTESYMETLRALWPRFHTDNSKRRKENKVQFSLITTAAGKYSFLSLVRSSPENPKDCNIGADGAKNRNADALVTIVQNLCDREAWEGRKSFGELNDTPDA